MRPPLLLLATVRRAIAPLRLVPSLVRGIGVSYDCIILILLLT